MKSSQSFRLWARRGSAGERVLAGVAAALCLALVVWLLVPAGNSTGGGVRLGAAGGSQEGPAGASPSGSALEGGAGSTGGTASGGGIGSAGGAAGSTGAGGARAASGPGGAQGGSAGKCPPGTDQGVSATQINVAVVIVNLAGQFGNSAASAPSPAEQQSYAQHVADYINSHGGVACRKFALQFFQANPADNNSLEQTCQQIAQTKPFAVADMGGYSLTPVYTCFPQAHLPLVACCLTDLLTVQQSAPYLLAMDGITDDLYVNGVAAMQQARFFDPANGFKAPLGVLYQDCFPDAKKKFFAALDQAGISGNKMVTYDFGCPALSPAPSDVQQAILKFQQAGVTRVTQMNFEVGLTFFTKVAQQQGFKPTYMMGAQGLGALKGQLAADPNNIDGAIAYVRDQEADPNTPGYQPTPGTQRCNTILTSQGSPRIDDPSGIGLGGVICNALTTIKVAAENAPQLTRAALAAGLMRAGTAPLGFPLWDANFSGLSLPYGGELYEAIQFHNKGCTCWQSLGPAKPLLARGS